MFVNPDVELLKARRQARIEARRLLAAKWQATPEQEATFEPAPKRPRPPVAAKAKQCPGCNRILGPVRRWFGDSGSKSFCNDCRPRAQQLKRKSPVRVTLARTCPACGTDYPKIRGNFGPSGTWIVCTTCHEKAGGGYVPLAKARRAL